MTTVSSYAKWKRDIQTILKEINSQKAKVTFVYGAGDFLLARARKFFEKEGANWPLTVLGESSLNDGEDFLNLTRQKELFQQNPIYLVWALEKQAKINLLLKILPKLRPKTPIIIFCKVETLKVKHPDPSLLGQLFCPVIFARDLSEVVLDLSKERSISLEPEAKRYLEESFGENVFQIEQELEKLSLIYAKRSNRSLSREDIASHVGFLREDHSFAISQLLLEHKVAEASLLIVSLLRRGHSPLGILTLIVRFLRKLVLAKSYQTQGSDMARALNLPAFVATRYVALARRFSESELNSSLMAAHQAEWALKTNSRVNPALILDELIAIFAHKAY